MKKVLLLLTGIGLVVSMYAGSPVLTVTKTDKWVTPDGVITAADEPWTTTWITNSYTSSVTTTTGMKSHFQIAYNDVYLWVLTEQKDNTTVDSCYWCETHERDCWEVFVGMDTSDFANAGAYKAGDYQFRMDRGGEMHQPYNDTMGATKGKAVGAGYTFNDAGKVAQNNKNCIVVQTDDGTNFIQEWQLPWKGLARNLPDTAGATLKFLKNYIKFDIQAADNTTNSTGTGTSGRTQQNFWNDNTDSQWHNTRAFSLVYLNGAVDTTITAVHKTTLNKLSVVATNYNLQLSNTVTTAQVFDLTGKLIATVKNTNNVNIRNLASGIYILKTDVGNYKFVKK